MFTECVFLRESVRWHTQMIYIFRYVHQFTQMIYFHLERPPMCADDIVRYYTFKKKISSTYFDRCSLIFNANYHLMQASGYSISPKKIRINTNNILIRTGGTDHILLVLIRRYFFFELPYTSVNTWLSEYGSASSDSDIRWAYIRGQFKVF